MQFVEVKYRRTKNLGNYESEEVALTAVPAEEDNVDVVLHELKHKVLGELGLTLPAVEAKRAKQTTEVEAVEEEVEEAPAKAATKKKATKKKATTKKKSVGGSTQTSAGKGKKLVVVTYDRSVEAHRAELAEVLNDRVPEWKATPESRARAKELSTKLFGVDFLDGEGNVLGSFCDSVVELMEDDAL